MALASRWQLSRGVTISVTSMAQGRVDNEEVVAKRGSSTNLGMFTVVRLTDRLSRIAFILALLELDWRRS